MKGYMKIADIFHDLSGGIWLSVVTCFMLFLYTPLELLFTNQDEFWFDAYILFPVMAVVFCIVCIASILAFALLKRIHGKLYRVGLMLYFIVFICLYVEGNFLAAGLPPLDGEMIDWNLYTAERMKSIILLIIVTAVVATAFCRLKQDVFEKLVRVVSICMTLMLGVTLLTLAVSNEGFAKKPSMSVTTGNMFEMSQDENFVILMLDAVDAQAMKKCWIPIESIGTFLRILRFTIMW